MIDFGLAVRSAKVEDHAVDLRLIKETVVGAHSEVSSAMVESFLAAYGDVGERRAKQVASKLVEIERGEVHTPCRVGLHPSPSLHQTPGRSKRREWSSTRSGSTSWLSTGRGSRYRPRASSRSPDTPPAFASSAYGRPLMVEDAGLSYAALNGFPGPFSSFVFKTLGVDGVLRLLDRVEDRAATFKSAVVY